MAIAGWDSYDGQGYEELVPESAYEPDVGESGPEVGSSWYDGPTDVDVDVGDLEAGVSAIEAHMLAGSQARVDLRSWALQGRWQELVGFALGLDERRQELGDPGDQSTSLAPSVAQLAACVRNLVVESGDDVTSVASRLGLDPAWADGVLRGEVSEVDPTQVDRLCEALESSPSELFGARERAMEALSSAVGRSEAWQMSTKVSTGTASVVAEVVDGAETFGSEAMARRLGSLNGEQVRDVVIALEEAHSEVRAWSKRLDEAPPPEVTIVSPGTERVPTAAIAEHIAFFQIDSGDDLDTIAHGLDVEPEWVRGVVSGEIDSVSMAEACAVCARLELSPEEVFGAGVGVVEPASLETTLGEDPYPSVGSVGLDLDELPEADLPFDPFIAGDTWPGEVFEPGAGPALDFGP